ncbi:type II 3-dehydroquinate dehydratase [Colwellia sp. MEBiC06753]
MTTKFNILIINGPNLNMLGKREPSIYGTLSLDELMSQVTNHGTKNDLTVEHFQSNSEGELISRIQAAYQEVDFIVINPAAYTHTSVGIRDALLSVSIPFIELHLSNIYQREAFRHHSYLSDIANGVICGLGAQGYFLALDAAQNWLKANQQNN